MVANLVIELMPVDVKYQAGALVFVRYYKWLPYGPLLEILMLMAHVICRTSSGQQKMIRRRWHGQV